MVVSGAPLHTLRSRAAYRRVEGHVAFLQRIGQVPNFKAMNCLGNFQGVLVRLTSRREVQKTLLLPEGSAFTLSSALRNLSYSLI